MKKLLILAPIILILLSGCGDTFKGVESDITIKISGTPGLEVSGHYAFISTGAVPKPLNVKGKIPAEYKGRGLTAGCLFRKTTPQGNLKVEIFRDGKVIAESETETPMGFVSLSPAPPEVKSFVGQLLSKILG